MALGVLLRVAVAALSGAILFLLFRVVRYHLFPETMDLFELGPMLVLDALWATAVGFGLRAALTKAERWLHVAQMAGVLVMAVSVHNLYHWAPRTMSLAFSTEWVEVRREHSVPGTIFLAGRYHRFGEPDFLRHRASPAVITVN